MSKKYFTYSKKLSEMFNSYTWPDSLFFKKKAVCVCTLASVYKQGCKCEYMNPKRKRRNNDKNIM